MLRWHVAIVWPGLLPNDRNMATQHVATLLDTMLRAFGHRVATLKFDHGQTTPNKSQHIATRWPNARNMLRPTLLRYVALACCHRLAGA